MATGALLTLVANIAKRPPLWGLSIDAARTLTSSLWGADGSKAQRELGITYTPIQLAVEETVASYMAKAVRQDTQAARRAGTRAEVKV